jgi:hypothetical protein
MNDTQFVPEWAKGIVWFKRTGETVEVAFVDQGPAEMQSC